MDMQVLDACFIIAQFHDATAAASAIHTRRGAGVAARGPYAGPERHSQWPAWLGSPEDVGEAFAEDTVTTAAKAAKTILFMVEFSVLIKMHKRAVFRKAGKAPVIERSDGWWLGFWRYRQPS